MKIIFCILCTCLLIGAFSSCRSTKRIQTAISKRDSLQVPIVESSADRKADSVRFIREIFRTVDSNRIDFKTFSAKVKVDFEGKDGKKSDFNANIRLYKDSVMWISINALLGIEAFRVLITPDSVKVMNKVDKVIQLRSVSYLKEVAKIPFTFHDLQELLIGNPIYLDSNIVSYRREANGITLVSVGEVFKHFLMVSTTGYLPTQSKLDDVNPTRTRTCYIGYGDYQMKNNKHFSAFRKITVVESSKLDIELQFKQIDFNVDLNIPFTIPKNYKRE
ncbi:MAG: DUF4292 domain-containing protein [Chitinophagaceae bacterium]|nr:MAG: DUF4292 domain-containing protein [Chitinophagaceae bacterium]